MVSIEKGGGMEAVQIAVIAAGTSTSLAFVVIRMAELFIFDNKPIFDDDGFWVNDDYIPFESIVDNDENSDVKRGGSFWLVRLFVPSQTKTFKYINPSDGKVGFLTITNRMSDYEDIIQKISDVLMSRKWGCLNPRNL